MGAVVFACNLANGPAQTFLPADVKAPFSKLAYDSAVTIFGLSVSAVKGCCYGAVWPFTLWQARYLYRRDGHVNSIVCSEYSDTDMYKEELRKLREKRDEEA